MCRTVHTVLQSLICGIQMLVRIFITMLLMLENLIRMFMQTFYNFVSFMLQMISLLPICVVFLVTSKLKCFMCGGGGPCQIKSGGSCDCAMSAVAVIIVFFILRATGLLDKIFYKLGYAKAKPMSFTRFMPTPGDITECSRNDSDYYESTTEFMDSTETTDTTDTTLSTPLSNPRTTITSLSTPLSNPRTTITSLSTPLSNPPTTETTLTTLSTPLLNPRRQEPGNWSTTTAVYYLA